MPLDWKTYPFSIYNNIIQSDIPLKGLDKFLGRVSKFNLSNEVFEYRTFKEVCCIKNLAHCK
jgi:hypothetical protein